MMARHSGISDMCQCITFKGNKIYEQLLLLFRFLFFSHSTKFMWFKFNKTIGSDISVILIIHTFGVVSGFGNLRNVAHGMWSTHRMNVNDNNVMKIAENHIKIHQQLMAKSIAACIARGYKFPTKWNKYSHLVCIDSIISKCLI